MEDNPPGEVWPTSKGGAAVPAFNTRSLSTKPQYFCFPSPPIMWLPRVSVAAHGASCHFTNTLTSYSLIHFFRIFSFPTSTRPRSVPGGLNMSSCSWAAWVSRALTPTDLAAHFIQSPFSVAANTDMGWRRRMLLSAPVCVLLSRLC